MGKDRQRLVGEIMDLKSEIASLENLLGGVAGSGAVGINPLPDVICRLRADLAGKVAQLEAMDGSPALKDASATRRAAPREARRREADRTAGDAGRMPEDELGERVRPLQDGL